MLDTQGVDTDLGRARPEVTPLVDTTSTRGREPPPRQEIICKDKKRQKKYSKGLDKSGHIEGLFSEEYPRVL